MGMGVAAGTEPSVEPTATGDDAPAVGANLRRLRIKRGLSLERLARHSGVSRAMLSQIELGQSAPTITTVTAPIQRLVQNACSRLWSVMTVWYCASEIAPVLSSTKLRVKSLIRGT